MWVTQKYFVQTVHWKTCAWGVSGGQNAQTRVGGGCAWGALSSAASPNFVVMATPF
jgi:hypothetical protein